MALNASGVMRLSGSVAGSSIAIELGLAANSTVSLAGAGPRGLAGIASGAIRLGADFYGKSMGNSVGLFYGGLNGYGSQNKFTRIDKCGALLSEATLGNNYFEGAMARVSTTVSAHYSGMYGTYLTSNSVRRYNKCGTAVGSVTTAGTFRFGLSGTEANGTAIYIGGAICTCGYNPSQIRTRINACGTIIGSEVSPTDLGYPWKMGASTSGPLTGTYAMFYGGVIFTTGGCMPTCVTKTKQVHKLNSCGSLVASVTNASYTAIHKCGTGAATTSSNMMLYGGYICGGGQSNEAVRFNFCGTMIGTSTVSTTRSDNSGAPNMGGNALFFGGFEVGTITNAVVRINSSGALVGSKTAAGSTRGCSRTGTAL